MKNLYGRGLVNHSFSFDDAKVAAVKAFEMGNGPRVVFGINELTDSIIENFVIDYVVDEFSSAKSYKNIELIDLDCIPLNSIVVSVVIGRPKTVQQKLDSRGICNIDYFAFWKLSNKALPQARHWEEFRADYEKYQSVYTKIWQRLSDEESKKAYRDVINFRLNYDLTVMADYEDRQETQYFENFLALNSKHTFLDVGACEGETSIEFIRHCPDYERVLLFEPEPRNYVLATKALSKFSRIDFFNVGLADKSRAATIDSKGSRSQVTTHGGSQIQLVDYDNYVGKPCTFVKMDIEGGEMEALSGMRVLIADHQPILAISVYHHPEDLRRIYEAVIKIRADYRVYFRHYTEGVDESVMFFVPTSGH